eukprot:2754824-Amphidinium_carterae.1
MLLSVSLPLVVYKSTHVARGIASTPKQTCTGQDKCPPYGMPLRWRRQAGIAKSQVLTVRGHHSKLRTAL